jgi:hypothetical protein
VQEDVGDVIEQIVDVPRPGDPYNAAEITLARSDAVCVE